MLEKTLESPLDCKEIKPVNHKGSQHNIHWKDWCWSSTWSSDANSQFIGKVPDARKDWGQEKRVTEDEMAGWHHWFNGHELETLNLKLSPMKLWEVVGNREAWCAAVHGISKSRTWLSNNSEGNRAADSHTAQRVSNSEGTRPREMELKIQTRWRQHWTEYRH